MKSYFTNKGEWTTEANEVARKVERFLIQLYTEEAKAGRNFRELTSIVLSCTGMAECKTAVEVRK